MQYQGPTPQQERIIHLDILRGFALCGILIVNIQSFSMIGAAYFNPTAFGKFEGLNWLVWLVTHLFADQKFITIFSMLFGAGVVLMAQRAERMGKKIASLHFRRMLVLLIFGFVHAYFFWYGDILVLYSICGMLVFLFRRKRPVSLFILGLLFFSVSSLINVAGGLSMHYWPPEQIQEFSKFWQPPLELVEQEISAYQSGYWGQMDRRISDVLMMHTQAFPTWGFWRATGCMLFGMALFKLGFFSGKRPAKNYWTFLAIGIFIGLPTVLIGIQAFYKNDWHVSQFFLATQYNYWGSLLVSLGWISLVMLCIQKGILENLQLRLAAIGQLAFTNYLLQTIICTTIFYGHGLGLYGKVSRVSQLLIVIMIWVIQLMLSPEWLKKFRMGPFEWIWRSAAYMKTLPIRR